VNKVLLFTIQDATPSTLKFISKSFLFGSGCLARGVKVFSTFADNFNRRNDMIVKFLILGISLIYAVLLTLYYSG